MSEVMPLSKDPPEPYLRAGGWFIDTPDGFSGPWRTSEAARLAGSGDYESAWVEERKTYEDRGIK